MSGSRAAVRSAAECVIRRPIMNPRRVAKSRESSATATSNRPAPSSPARAVIVAARALPIPRPRYFGGTWMVIRTRGATASAGGT